MRERIAGSYYESRCHASPDGDAPGPCDVKDGDSFSGSELLRIAHLAGRAYDPVSQLRQAEANGSS